MTPPADAGWQGLLAVARAAALIQDPASPAPEGDEKRLGRPEDAS